MRSTIFATPLKLVIGGVAVAGILHFSFSPDIAEARNIGKIQISSTTTFNEVKREWSEAMAAIKGYSAAQRQQAVEESRELMDSLDARIDELESRAESEWDGLSKDARAKRQAALKTLRKQRSKLAEWYGGMKHSSSEAWNEVKEGFSGAYEDLTDAFSDASAEFK